MSEYDPNLHYVYFIREANTHFVKIGYANDPAKRLIELQIGNPHDLEVEYVIQLPDAVAARRIEILVQTRFEQSRIRGEWYVLTNADLANIRLMTEVAMESAKAERLKWHRRVRWLQSQQATRPSFTPAMPAAVRTNGGNEHDQIAYTPR